MTIRSAGRRLLAVLVAVTGLLSVALPVRADVSGATGVGETTGVATAYSGTFSDTTTSGDGHTLQINGEFAGIIDGNTLVDEFWCASSASPDALATTLAGCSLNGTPAISLGTFPGDISVGVGVLVAQLSDLPNGLILCGSGSSSFVETALGAASLSANGCSSTPTAVPQTPDLATVQADLLAIEQDGLSTVNRALIPVDRILDPGCPEAGC